MSTSTRLVCLKRPDGMIYRLQHKDATAIIAEKPEFKLVSKSTSKSFYKRLEQVQKNRAEFERYQVDFTTNQKVQKNFVQEEDGKVVAYRFRGTKMLTYEMPEDEKQAEEKKTWLQDIIDKACINPHDQSIKKSLLATLLAFFGLFTKKELVDKPKTHSVDLPLYQRYIFGYGTTDNIRYA
jgi:hypothetical protein